MGVGGGGSGFSLYDLMCHMIDTVRYQRLHRAVRWMGKRPWVRGCYQGET